ncbi:(2,3-dihydroxybenzoyl)adenylate synthase [Phytoactinopolyspora endophytica]|uniref:(2,3-dihydroxybenzoyl)adenylate synthase n=1 Tax=Phytoactinopolyspora endophytica TaxID=1642495 RepID=UPI001F0E8E5B|nr:(2,3-dihydroxybenzoyl)adenylate synthase [Phytoactinopolyspora endophytica]
MPRPTREGTVPWPEDVAERYVARGYWEGRSLGEQLVAVVDSKPDAVALVDGELRFTYRELIQRVDGAALRLRDLGLRPDDRIVVQLPNRWEFVVLTLACLRLGVIPVMALPAHREHEMSYLAEHSEARAITVPGVVKDFDHQAMAWKVAADVGSVDHVLVAGDEIRPDSVSLSALCDPADDVAMARKTMDERPPDSGSVAVFLLSGGTTGLPKLIARTHDDYTYNAKRSAQVCGFGLDTVYLGVLPLGHNFPLACPGILGALLVGGRVVVAPSPAPDKVFAQIERERVTATAVVPAVAQRWLEHREADHGHDLSSLRVLQVGGARLADEVARRVRPVLGCTLQQVFGMAEGLLNYTRLDDPEEVICTTQGRPMCAGDEIMVVDSAGEPVSDGEPGILLTRGPYTPRGYYRAGEQNATAFTEDGWYRSGDVVRIRPDGNLVVEGRDKDMINRAGENISAEEVENFAYQVDAVGRAAAVAMPDPDLGERVCLYVVPEPGRTVVLDDVRSAMERAGVARFKFPERLVAVDELPTTKVGKIDKKALRADVIDRLHRERP